MFELAPFSSDAPTQADVDTANAVLERRVTAMTEQAQNSSVQCNHCQQSNLIKELTLVEHYWYEAPWGCTGGDTYKYSFKRDAFLCPHCEQLSRLPEPFNQQRDFNDKNSPHIALANRLKSAFKDKLYDIEGHTGLSDTPPAL